MDGLGLNNMLSAEQVEKMFGNEAANESETQETTTEAPTSTSEQEETETAEVDFSDLLGNQPESVGSEKNTESNREIPESNNGSGTPQTNLFSSIARILRDKGVFPDLSDEDAEAINDEEALEKLFNDKVSNMFDERQRSLEKALQGGASTEEMQQYQQALQYAQFLDSNDSSELLTQEGEEGDKFRKNLMYQDYINRGMKHERALKLIQKSYDDGTEIEDAQEALESCKEFYKSQIDDFKQEFEERQKEKKASEEKQYASLKKKILDTEDFYSGVKVTKSLRQKAYDAITKPIYKDENGNFLTALQKYQKENPMDFMINMAMMMTLTDGFKNIEKLSKGKVNAEIKKSFAELENFINTSKRNSDGTLNLANTFPDDSERENWTLA